MRIASLVPSATEMLFALGLGDSVVAVTHECDFPPAAESRPRLTRSVIPEGLPPGEIDAAVRELTGAGRALYELDEPALARLDVDLIVTQALCAVCAVSYDDVRAVAARLPEHAARDLARPRDALRGDRRRDDPRRGRPASQDEAAELRAELERRIDAVAAAVAGAAAPARRGARVARPAVRRRPLGAGDGRARGRRGRARRAGAQVAHGLVGGGRRGAARGRRRDALRPLRRRGARAGARLPRRARRAAAPSASSPSTPRHRSRARGRGSSRASSCSRHILHPELRRGARGDGLAAGQRRRASPRRPRAPARRRRSPSRSSPRPRRTPSAGRGDSRRR